MSYDIKQKNFRPQSKFEEKLPPAPFQLCNAIKMCTLAKKMIMTFQLDRSNAFEPKPEMLRCAKTGYRIQNMERNVCGIATFLMQTLCFTGDRQNFVRN